MNRLLHFSHSSIFFTNYNGRNNSFPQKLVMRAIKKILLFVFIIIPSFSFAQYVTGAAPIQDGTITDAEYYNSFGVGASGSTWYMAWDNTNLYIAKTGGASGEPDILYFDTNPTAYSNGGVATGTNGQTTGQDDWNNTPNLPFVAKARVYWTDTYAEVSLNTGSGWSVPIVITTHTNSGNNREIEIPWSVLNNPGGIPAAFNWLATASSTGGYIYDQYPTVNYGGGSGGTPTYFYYQSVINSSSTGTTYAFSSNFLSFTNYNNSSYVYTDFLPTSLYDFTMGNSSSAGSVTMQTDITITGNLVVENGVLNSSGGDGSGYYKITMGNESGVLDIFTNSGGHIYGTDNGVGNNLSLVVEGFITLGGDPATPNTDDHKFYNIFIQSSGGLSLGQGILCRYGGFNVAGILQINANGYVEGTATSAIPAFYLDGTASLIYNNGGNYLVTDYEWPTTNSPANVTVQNVGTAIVLNDAKTIDSILTIANGTITTTAANLLTINNTAVGAISGGSTTGYIIGPVQWNLPSGATGNYTLPLGDGNVYLPFAISPTTSGATSVTVQAFDTVSGGTPDEITLDSISSTEYWQVTTASGFSGGAVSLARSTPAIGSMNTIGQSATQAGIYSSIGGTPGTLNGQGGVITSNTIGGVGTSYLVLANVFVSLPVTFTGVNASLKEDGEAEINWQVVGESNIKSYTVERSTDGSHFEDIGTLSATGAVNYDYTDAGATTFTGTIYYRIKTTGTSGNNSYSIIVRLVIGQGIAGITIYPNPVKNGQLQLQFLNKPAGQYIASLKNIAGQSLYASAINYFGGTAEELLQLPSTLAAGIYELEIISPLQKTYVLKVIIER